MTELEASLQSGLAAFDEETAVVATPDLLAVRRRAAGAYRSGRRWPKVGAVVAVGALVTSGSAVAAGILPRPVEDALSEFRSWGFDAGQGAERMASTTEDGVAYDLWVAPLNGGGWCSSVLVDSERVGEIEHGGGSACHPDGSASAVTDEFVDLAWPDQVSDNSTGQGPGAEVHATASGRAPAGTARVEFTFGDGSTLSVFPQGNGWFVTTFPKVADGTLVTEVRAVAASGQVLDSASAD